MLIGGLGQFPALEMPRDVYSCVEHTRAMAAMGVGRPSFGDHGQPHAGITRGFVRADPVSRHRLGLRAVCERSRATTEP